MKDTFRLDASFIDNRNTIIIEEALSLSRARSLCQFLGRELVEDDFLVNVQIILPRQNMSFDCPSVAACLDGEDDYYVISICLGEHQGIMDNVIGKSVEEVLVKVNLYKGE